MMHGRTTSSSTFMGDSKMTLNTDPSAAQQRILPSNPPIPESTRFRHCLQAEIESETAWKLLGAPSGQFSARLRIRYGLGVRISGFGLIRIRRVVMVLSSLLHSPIQRTKPGPKSTPFALIQPPAEARMRQAPAGAPRRELSKSVEGNLVYIHTRSPPSAAFSQGPRSYIWPLARFGATAMGWGWGAGVGLGPGGRYGTPRPGTRTWWAIDIHSQPLGWARRLTGWPSVSKPANLISQEASAPLTIYRLAE
jgi:hypothetical protein